MIQTILFFLLGFLCAGFLALMIAPALWRRAVALTRKRIEATVPLSLSEIQADKDRIRAEFAMSTRRLEMQIKSFKDKAASQTVEINRYREEAARLSEEVSVRNDTISELEARGSDLRTELKQREEELSALRQQLAEAEQTIEERAAEVEELGRQYEEASFLSSSRQIELVARDTELEKLSEEAKALREQRKEQNKALREAKAERKSIEQSLQSERKRAADLDRKLERLMSQLSGSEEKLQRRENELARLRENMKQAAGAGGDLQAALNEALEERARLEAEVEKMAGQLASARPGATDTDTDTDTGKTLQKPRSERDRMQSRLTTLLRENKKLRDELAAYERSKSEGWSEETRQNAVLREQISNLAAEVVHLTTALDGPQSPVAAELAHEAPERNSDEQESVPSLADRIRALQDTSSAAG